MNWLKLADEIRRSARESPLLVPQLITWMSHHQPVPFAKRQKVTNHKPRLDPPAPRQPEFFEPGPSRHRHHDQHEYTDENSVTVSQHRTRSNTHGNFVGYYTRRRANGDQAETPTKGDPRLALLPREWFEGKKVLDIGCNAGRVTVEIAQRMGAARVVGVDIDEELVRLARKHGECWKEKGE